MTMKLLIILVFLMGFAFPPAWLAIPILLICGAVDRAADKKEADRIALLEAVRSLKKDR